MLKLSAVRASEGDQVQRELHVYDVIGKDGAVRRLVREVLLRYSTVEELEGRLRKAGLRLDGAYGGYDFAPYNEASEYLVIVARHTEGP